MAEKKYAAGTSLQSDQMKAHFELTNLELELIRLKQQEQTLQDKMRALLHEPQFERLNLIKLKLKLPTYNRKKALPPSVVDLKQRLKKRSYKLTSELHLLEEAKYQSSLAKWAFMPDVQLQYQQRISGEPTDSHIYSVNFTTPLWFWKKSSKVTAAHAKKMAQQSVVHHTLHETISKSKAIRPKNQGLFKNPQNLPNNSHSPSPGDL